MDIRPFSRRQIDAFKSGGSLWASRLPVLRKEGELSGGLHWKAVRGREYLVRYWTDPVTGAKRSKSLGSRSPETEKLSERFFADRSEFDAERAGFDGALAMWSSSAEELELPKLPPFVSQLYLELHGSDLGGVALIDNYSWLPQSAAMGAEFSGWHSIDPFDLGTHAVMLLVPDGMDEELVAQTIMRSERNLERTGRAFMRAGAPEIAAIILRKSHLAGWAIAGHGDEAGKALSASLDAPVVRAVLPDAGKRPLEICSVQPTASMLMSWISSSLHDTDHPEIALDQASRLAEFLLEQNDALMHTVVEELPELMDYLQAAGGEDGPRI